MKRFGWLLVWLVQIAAVFVLGCILALSLWLNHALYGVCMWGLMPLIGLASAYIATVKGLLNYAAWIAPPAAMAFSHMIVWYYPPATGAILVCAFVSLIGAAAGEVKLQFEKKQK